MYISSAFFCVEINILVVLMITETCLLSIVLKACRVVGPRDA